MKRNANIEKEEIDKRKGKRYGNGQDTHYGKILLAENVAIMAAFKVMQAELEAGQQQVLDTIAAEIEGENTKAEAQKTTELKYKSWNKLRKAVRKYINVMKEALEDDPQTWASPKKNIFLSTTIDNISFLVYMYNYKSGYQQTKRGAKNMFKKLTKNAKELQKKEMDETKAGWILDCLIHAPQTALDCVNTGIDYYILYDMDKASSQ